MNFTDYEHKLVVPPEALEHHFRAVEPLRDPAAQAELIAQAFMSMSYNHIWLNDLVCLAPTPEFLQHLGGLVLSMLNAPNNTLPRIDPARDAAELVTPEQRAAPTLYFRVSKS